jgi:hypothetical protein
MLSGVPGQNVAVKAVVTPVLIGGASLAGRRFGHHVGGWLVALPMTSGPVAFFLATEHGVSFAAGAAVGMLAATLSQVGFALAYGSVSRRGAVLAFFSGAAAFAAATIALSFLHWSAPKTFLLVLGSLVVGYAATRRRSVEPPSEPTRLPRWDVPVRTAAATTVVVVVTTLAPVIGSHLAGLLSPFPVFGASSRRRHSSHARRCGRDADTRWARARPHRAGGVLSRAGDDALEPGSGRVRVCDSGGVRGTDAEPVRDSTCSGPGSSVDQLASSACGQDFVQRRPRHELSGTRDLTSRGGNEVSSP